MKKYIYFLLMALSYSASSGLNAQCTPTNCLASLPAYGGICDTLLSNGNVGTFYSDFESFHITTSCFDAGLINPANAGTGIRITSVHTFTYTNLPAGITASSNQATYNSPANGCVLFQGVPTQAGVFAATINFLANVTAYPFGGGACSGFSINQNNNAADYELDLIILPNASFTIPVTVFCTTDPSVSLTVTGTAGGTFSGPGVTGTTFDPAAAGPGTHTITYSVTAQEGSAIAPASNSSTIDVTVVAPSYDYYVDADLDGYGEAGSTPITTCSVTAPAGYSINDLDCDDNASGINPGALEIPGNSIDEDCDGFDAALDNDLDTYDNTLDCNDNDPAIYPGATEICDGVDNNCDGNTDEGFSLNTYYLDGDTDGVGTIDSSITSCDASAPVGYSATSTDCDDANALIYPGATELCDGIDNNCSGTADEGITINTYYLDADFDGYGVAATSIDTCAVTAPLGYASVSGDCDDSNSNINPGITELCDGIDNNCNSNIDEGFTINTYYEDADNDNYGNPSVTATGCTPPSGYVDNNTDCDDTNPFINPFMPDNTGNGIDDNCDGIDGTLGLNSVETQLGIQVYPNPASEVLFLSGDVDDQLQLQIYNLQGQLVTTQIISMQQLFEVSISHLAQGSYIVEVTSLKSNVKGYTQLVVAR